jgi:hypothetical protein
VEDSTVRQPKQNQDLDKTAPNFSALDKLFITLTAAGFLGGTSLSILLSYSLSVVPIVPASFFGLGMSSLVYHFMGGIKSDTKFQVGAIKVTGTLAGLIATIWILNMIFEKQIEDRIKVTSLLLNPEEHSVLALKKLNGEAVDLSVNVGIPVLVGKTIAAPDRATLEHIKKLCRQGRGFCKEPEIAVKLQKDASVPLGQAKVCFEQFDQLVGYPLIISNATKTKVGRVKTYLTDDCQDQPNQPISIKISSQDAKNILGTGVTGQGTATIAPLRDLPPKPFENIAQKSSSNSPTFFSLANSYSEEIEQ